ncbi:MAG: ArsR family transcriptional regulator [Proteobacteria bacterium]|jgi:ArsR family transcriptional regulator|nr:MAG: ArsR family transcriptional regulator [Pseudomonadota bacterium]
MALAGELEIEKAVAGLKAAADSTRLRILLLLSEGELNVKDLTNILGQSQPRISRHVKLLGEAGLIERVREGSWVFCRLADGPGGALARALVQSVNVEDPTYVRDRQRAEEVKAEREAAAQAYFRAHAADWDRIRALHVSEAEVEAAMREALGTERVELLLDLGTGTGRTLELFSDIYDRGIGIDLNQSMLAYARAKLRRTGLDHVQVRHGDIYNLSFPDGIADAIVMHQVLHFLSDPGYAIKEAGRVLAPGGRLLIVDFAPHQLEFLRDEFAHERLGFSSAQVGQWLSEAGLALVSSRDLPPPAGSESGKLTVSLWLATRPVVRERSLARRSVARQSMESSL